MTLLNFVRSRSGVPAYDDEAVREASKTITHKNFFILITLYKILLDYEAVKFSSPDASPFLHNERL